MLLEIIPTIENDMKNHKEEYAEDVRACLQATSPDEAVGVLQKGVWHNPVAMALGLHDHALRHGVLPNWEVKL